MMVDYEQVGFADAVKDRGKRTLPFACQARYEAGYKKGSKILKARLNKVFSSKGMHQLGISDCKDGSACKNKNPDYVKGYTYQYELEAKQNELTL